MTWLRGLNPFTLVAPLTATSKSRVCSKNQNSWSLKKICFHVLFHVIITNDVPETTLQAYMSLPRHIRRGVLIRRNIAQIYVQQLVASNCKESRKCQRRIMFERNYSSFFHHCLLSFVARCSKNTILCKPKWGAQADVRGGTAPLASP